ncbi:hypothetical protein LSAT2_027530, partial [Lamellibrachia satsuma]
MDDNNQQIDWAKGLVTVKVCHNPSDTDTVAKTEAGDLTLKLVTSGDTKNTVTVKTTKHQTSHKMLTGGFVSVDDLTAQYQSGGVGHVQVIHCRPRVNQGQDRQILEEQ